MDPVDPRMVRVFKSFIINFIACNLNLDYEQNSEDVILKTQRPFRAPGRIASGVFMRLVSLWWELPPRLNSNISI